MWVFCGYWDVGIHAPRGLIDMPGLRYKLTAATFRSTVRTGRHADGAGLYLQVTRHPVLGNIRKSWLVRNRGDNGRIREVGIGSAEDVSLADAREKAAEVRETVKAGRDLIGERQKERKAAAIKKAREIRSTWESPES